LRASERLGNEPLAFRWNQLSDQNGRQTRAGEGLAGFSLAVSGNERRHAEAAIEGPQHFRFIKIARQGEPRKHRLRGEGAEIEQDGETVVEHARQVVRVAAASDVGERMDAPRLA
jgi:hypothetical protein